MTTECAACADRKMKIKVRHQTREAIRSGALVRQPCVDCVAKGFLDRNLPVHAHHEDYSKPLEVIWVCATHHRVRHSRFYASNVAVSA